MVVIADPQFLRGIPEYVETKIGECLEARNGSLITFRELGPPDLCHLVKSNSKSSKPTVGSYHLALGVDASTSASFSAYINSLTYNLATVAKPNAWKIISGTYCCFNAFSRVDVRVEVRIPGGVEAYIIDLQGDKHPIANEDAMWRETLCSAVLRAILMDHSAFDGESEYAIRKVDPLPDLHAEKKFLDAAKIEFYKGWQLGSEEHIQVPTTSKNHMALGIMKYFGDAGRYSECAQFLTPLFQEDLSVGALLAECYIASDEELKAVAVMYEASKSNPVSVDLILVQIDYLLEKNRRHKALYLAQLAVTRMPLEYRVWEKLTELFIHLEDYESALLALNSCPMYTFPDKDDVPFPTPIRKNLPIKVGHLKPDYDEKTAVCNSGSLSEENNSAEKEIHPEIQRLGSLSLRGTFIRSYRLLIKIWKKAGWEELLKYRGKVFVMEEEYRVFRAMAETEVGESPTKDITDEDEAAQEMENISLDDVGAGTPRALKKKTYEIFKKSGENAFEQPIKGRIAQLPFTPANFKFRHKRLCEKWLDNLFMLLYSDLRVYAAMNRDLQMYQKELENVEESATLSYTYRKSGTEWEILGDLAVSLGHLDTAKASYQFCVNQMLSPTALLSLIKIYTDEGDVVRTLQYVVKLAMNLDRVYAIEIYPSPLANYLFKLIKTNGLAVVQNALVSMNVPAATYRYLTRFFEYVELFRVQGYDC